MYQQHSARKCDSGVERTVDGSSICERKERFWKMKHAVSNVMNEILFVLLFVRMRLVHRQTLNTKGILLIRFSHIGDFVLWLDAAKEFRHIYPEEKITFVCDRYKDVCMLAEKTGYFDEVIVLRTRGIGRIFGILKAMRLKCRIVINADPSRTVLSDLIVLAVQAQERIAQKADTTRMSKRQVRRSDGVYHRIIRCGGIHTMELIRNAQFIRGLSKDNTFCAAVPQIAPLLPQSEVRKTLHLPDRYFVLCPGGEVPQKYWDAKKYAAVLNKIFAQERSLYCIVVGTTGEENELQKICQHINTVEKKRILSRIGKTSLIDYIELIRCAAFLLSNDTSAAHIAAATGTQAVVIAQSWDWGRFYPYRVEQHIQKQCCPRSVHAHKACAGCAAYGIRPGRFPCLVDGRVLCIRQIMVEQVMAQVRQVLETRQ